MSDELTVEAREALGTTASRRLRAEGKVPAILYGHGEGTISLSLNAKGLGRVLRHGGQVVKLQGAVSDNALIKDVQWDTFGADVLHVDLIRVSADERIEVSVAVELKGDAPGLANGGILDQPEYELEISCLATSVPEKLILRVSGLDIGGALHASDVELPAGVELITPAETLVVQCSEPVATKEEVEEEAAEPEVIGGKPSEDEESAG